MTRYRYKNPHRVLHPGDESFNEYGPRYYTASDEPVRIGGELTKLRIHCRDGAKPACYDVVEDNCCMASRATLEHAHQAALARSWMNEPWWKKYQALLK